MPEEHLQSLSLQSFGCSIISSCSMWLNATSVPFLLSLPPKFLSPLLRYSRRSCYLLTSVSQISPEFLSPSFISALHTTWTWLLVPTTWLMLLSLPHICRMLPLLSHPILAQSVHTEMQQQQLYPIFWPCCPTCQGAEGWEWAGHEIRHEVKAARLRQDPGKTQNQITASVDGAMLHFLQLFLRHSSIFAQNWRSLLPYLTSLSSLIVD